MGDANIQHRPGLSLLADQQEKKGNLFTLADLEKWRFTDQTKHPSPVSTIQINGGEFGMEGMFSGISGPPKSGKTTVMGCMVASTLTERMSTDQALGITGSLANGRGVVCLDFEQHMSLGQKLHDTVLRHANLSKSPKNLHIMGLLDIDRNRRMEVVRAFFRETDPHLFLLDGCADLAMGVNDEESAIRVVEELCQLAHRHKTCLIATIHENKGNGLIRGHLGAEMERKCAAIISIKKDRTSNTHSVESKLNRMSADFEPVYFRYCIEQKMMLLLDAMGSEDHAKRLAQKKAGKDKNSEFLGGLMALAFKQSVSLSKEQLIAQVRHFDKDSGSDKTAERRIRGAMDLGILNENNKVYTRPTTSQ